MSINQDFFDSLKIPEEYERLKYEYLSMATNMFANKYQTNPWRLIKIFGKKETYRLATQNANAYTYGAKKSKKKIKDAEEKAKAEEDARRYVDRTPPKYYWEEEA